MTPQIGVGIISLLGAVIFTAMGYMIAKLRSSSDPQSPREPLLKPDPEQATQIAFLDEQLTALNSQLAISQSHLAQSQTNEKSLSDELSKLKQDNQAKDQRLQELMTPSGSHHDLEARLVAVSESKMELEVQLSTATFAQKQAEQRCKELEEELEQRDTEPTRIQTVPPEAVNIARVEEDLKHARSAQQKLSEQRRALQDQAQKLHRDLSIAKTEREALRSEKSILKKDLNEAQKKIQMIENELDALMEKKPRRPTRTGLQDQATLLKTTQDELIRVRTEAEKMKQQLAQVEVIKGELNQAKAKVVDYNRTKNQLISAQNELAKARDEVRRLRSDIEIMNASTGKDNTQISDELSRVRKQVEHLEGQLSEERANTADLSRRLEDQRATQKKIDDLTAQLAAADNKLSQQEDLDQERFDLKQQITDLEAQLETLKVLEAADQERQDLALEVVALKQKEQELDQLKEAKAHLMDELSEANREREALTSQLQSLSEAKDDRTDLALQVEVLSSQVKELEQLREENMELRQSADGVVDLRQKLQQLEQENAGLRSHELIQKTPAPRPMLDTSGEGMGHSLQAILQDIVSENSRGVVLADDAGLVIAGIGDYSESLAALATLFSDLGKKALSLLPLGTLQQMTISDANSLTFTAQPFPVATEKMVLATLTVGAGPKTQDVDMLITKTLETIK